MLKPSVGIALEGLPYIIIAAFTTLIFAVMGFWPVALLGLGVTAFIGHFFRDPERVGPEDAEAVSSPADGKVIKVSRETDPVTGDVRQVIAIFMNVFNVHVNRMPVSGKVEIIRYIPGKFFNASFDKASKDNERNIVVVTGKGNQRFTMVQIAGLIARRIVCWAEPGDKLKRGERFGLIKFGSRVDLYIPDGYVPVVSVGQKVVAGETSLAEKRPV
ncbi:MULTISPECIES: phosphatidylserine decarboxylase family protein [unclassified Pseudodesulfovibrio]|uniref:phosphatidylserine decarboxylase family protein n=1 Tax=unclassified Pseudodesulfovibrio TaxID=2661612 RepID=UPI000FEB9941|nr:MULTISPECIES: phosphatidylserine decarboxylase family protein [unclassified Pseudodesulfovibrio]MCJ2164088.1 phosphatidylserine decarboxylase family protein [Pseudodesulfovibrio sp. S3-i]RWU05281.1 phosphatidylserine decarboxylase family protein [Pseudodesulfovibrio sp. S3]